jgi:hypothetical protein
LALGCPVIIVDRVGVALNGPYLTAEFVPVGFILILLIKNEIF